MITVYGTVCRDRLHRVEKLPEPGGYVEIFEESDTLGGEAYNTGKALLTWGEEIILSGNSLGSKDRDSLLTSEGFSTDFLPKDEHFEPVCDIYVTPDGQRTMFGRGFREMPDWGDSELFPLSPGHWITADANHGKTGHRALERGQAGGMFTYAEDFVEPDSPATNFWQSSTDWVARKGDIQANVSWLTKWLDTRGGFGILSDGANGFVAGGQDISGESWAIRHYPPFPCPSLVDSTGAGDIFRAGMLLGLAKGWGIPDCLRFAAAAGSLNCQHLGASSNIPVMSEVEAVIALHPEVARRYE